MHPNKQKVPARYLMTGDRLCTGETVVAVSRGALTPPGKVEVTLEKEGRRRTPLWGASTTINVSRPTPDPVVDKVEAIGRLLSDLAKIAISPNGSALLTPHADTLTAALTTHQLICSACVEQPRKEASRLLP
jgi:hypothetical protein